MDWYLGILERTIKKFVESNDPIPMKWITERSSLTNKQRLELDTIAFNYGGYISVENYGQVYFILNSPATSGR